ncbi:MAG: exo-alpha-sialidase [Lacunisphaera sp.]|nr:exo-alpha-sialidase [Lacunisphaera sp.]
MIKLIDTGIVYRNPKPHLRAIHTWHPSIVVLSANELLSSFDLGQGAESMDYSTWVARSTDGGRNWSEPYRMFQDPIQATTHSARMAIMLDGSIVAIGVRAYRDNPSEGIINRATFGFTKSDVILLRSSDRGMTFQGPEVIKPPLVGPAFELCHRIVPLKDGRWLCPTNTWKGWNGEAPNGMKSVAFVSTDQGKTWPTYIDIMDDYRNGVIHFEQGFAQIGDGRLVDVAWAFHEPSGTSFPNRLAISQDGQKFGPIMPAKLSGETIKIIALGGNTVFGLYRRIDQKGLWAFLADVGQDSWTIRDQVPMWQGADANVVGGSAGNNATNLSTIKFGCPMMSLLPDGSIFGVFWCMEDNVQNIRWLRIQAK